MHEGDSYGKQLETSERAREGKPVGQENLGTATPTQAGKETLPQPHTKLLTPSNMKYRDIAEFSDEALLITWEDGHESVYTYNELRKSCPCATCNTERKAREKKKTGLRRVLPMGVPRAKVKPNSIENVGLYGLRFNWNDGHHTGIYTFELLRWMCTCEECEKKKG